MKGLELSRQYFEACGRPMLKALEEKFPELSGQFAAGLVGHGSECLGFDDALSSDHDFGPAFCVWLPESLYQKYGQECQKYYDALPQSFAGCEARKVTRFGEGRVGVLCLEDFYYGLIGLDHVPQNNMEWMRVPEERLLLATNGAVFLDDRGQFLDIRKGLLQFYPEDVLLKKLAARTAAMAQSGQYNYSRLSSRGEWTGAFLALEDFIKNTCSAVHLLNRRYTPYYKWMHRSLRDMACLGEVYGLIDQLTASFDSRQAWTDAGPEDFLYGIINTKDSRAVLIETICQLVILQLEEQGLSEAHDMYLEAHAISMMGKIRDPKIASMQLLEA